jgi:hypothetical protein
MGGFCTTVAAPRHERGIFRSESQIASIMAARRIAFILMNWIAGMQEVLMPTLNTDGAQCASRIGDRVERRNREIRRIRGSVQSAMGLNSRVRVGEMSLGRPRMGRSGLIRRLGKMTQIAKEGSGLITERRNLFEVEGFVRAGGPKVAPSSQTLG